MTKMTELKQKSVAELEQFKLELHKEQFNLRMQRGSNNGSFPKNHLFKVVRRNIARVETLLGEKNNKQEGVS